MRTTIERFWAKVGYHSRADVCWEWLRYRTPAGYGQFGVDGKLVLAHRYSYELLIGPIPNGLTLDHLCRNRGCVNPFHLEAVTLKVNCLRGISPSANNARKSLCPQGHPYSEENTYLSKNGRQCRICREHSSEKNREQINERQRQHRAENKEQLNERRRQDRKDNKDHFNARQRQYRADHKESTRRYKVEYRAKNGERINELQRQRYANKKALALTSICSTDCEDAEMVSHIL